MTNKDIIAQLPYTEPFLFVDKLLSVSEEGIKGVYTFKKDEYFYRGHFKNNPITPGVILTECMAQIGLVCMGIFLFDKEENPESPTFAMSSTEIDYYLPVFPGETVKVISEKVYYRFGKLKCKVKMTNGKGETVCGGTISGMVLKEQRK